MKEYIERETTIKELCQVSAPTPSESYIVEKCINKIDQMSAADVVEVVRCKDCEYWRQVNEDIHACFIFGFEMDYDEYCSYGERKEE